MEREKPKNMSTLEKILFYGAEQRTDPEFTWTKHIIRAAVVNLVGGLIAFYVMQYFFNDMENDLKKMMEPPGGLWKCLLYLFQS